MRLLLLLLLPLASGLEARARPKNTLAQFEVAPPSEPNKTALLVVAGLTRHFERTWPKIRDSLLKPNEAAGYKFTIIVSTSTGVGCNPDSPKFHSRRCEEKVDTSWHLERIRSIMAPSEVLDHSRDLCSPVAGAGQLLGTHSTLNETGGLEGDCAPWFARVARVLERVSASGQKFDRVLAIRPDIAFHRASNDMARLVGDDLQGAPKLLIDQMCAKRPGFNIVTPVWPIFGRSWLHDHDLDFTQILCPGEKLDVFLEATRAVGDHCHLRKGDKEPPLPPGFHSTRGWNEFGYFCRFVQVWNKSNIDMHHWDDTFACDWN